MLRYFNYLGTTLELEYGLDTWVHLAPVFHFFRHHCSQEPRNTPLWTLRCRRYDSQSAAWNRMPGATPRVIRRSSAAPFNLDALHFIQDGRQHFANAHLALVAPPRHGEPDTILDLFIGEGAKYQLIELLRDLVLRHEEARGTIVLHAGALRWDRDGRSTAILIAGAKGSGKTTLLLALLALLPVRFFSGDKVFCELQDGEPVVSPWRDWPHIGWGTAQRFPKLENLVRSQARLSGAVLGDRDKLLIDPDLFEQSVATPFEPGLLPIGLVLLPQLTGADRTVLKPIEALEEKQARFREVVERTAATSYFDWQSFFVPRYAKQDLRLDALRPHLRRIPFVVLHGRLEIDQALGQHLLSLAGG